MVNLLLTEECNKNCSFCFAGPSSGTNAEHREKIELADVARFARWCRDNGIDRVGLLGGEPTTYHSFNEVLEIFDRNGIGVQLISNFSFPAPDKDLNHDIIAGYLLNVAALQNQADFERFKENMERLTPKNREKVSLGYTIATAEEDFSDLKSLAKEYNVKNIRMDFATPSIDEGNDFDDLSKEEKRRKIEEILEIAKEANTNMSFDCNLSTQVKVLFSEKEIEKIKENDSISYEDEKRVCNPIIDVDVDLSAFHCFPLRDLKVDNVLKHSYKELKAELYGQRRRLEPEEEQKQCLAFNS